MFCPKCGTENDDKAKFCKGCGAALKPSLKEKAESNEKSSNNKLIIAVAVIICICVIAGGLFIMIGNNSDNNVATSTNDLTDSVNVDDENRYENFSESEWDQSSYTLDDIYTAHTPEDVKTQMFEQADANGDGVLTGDEIKEMDYLLKHSDYTYKGPNSSSSSRGIDFAEAATYFPEASSTVLAHVFDEADTDADGYLSGSELELFKKVRDHTKKYAVNIKNEYHTGPISNNDKTGYCADHGRVAVVDDSQCPYCIKLGYDDTRTKTSSW